ncbi:MAG: DUF1697 domain-containing protein [Caulobacteraceae bacterium]|nr:DUF1697 domain-containing protein [Caulobacteraceae bacterium]
MTKHIALLRAVNVGGHGKVRMADLQALAEAMGFTQVRTLLQSGNLVFDADGAAPEDLEQRIEAELAGRLDLASAVIVRSAQAWAGIIAANPFADAARDDPGRLLVMPLKAEPAADREAALQAAIKGRETARVIRACAYLVYPDGIGDSKLTNAVIERQLGAKGTARNWNTVTKLAALAES